MDAETIEAVETYLDAYSEVNETKDVLGPITPAVDVPEHDAKDACYRAFDHLDNEYKRSTLETIYRAVDQWYRHFIDERGLATTNPATAIDSNYNWNDGDGQDARKLSADQVRALYEAAGTNRDRTVVIVLCAWGLRTEEVATLHRIYVAKTETLA